MVWHHIYKKLMPKWMMIQYTYSYMHYLAGGELIIICQSYQSSHPSFLTHSSWDQNWCHFGDAIFKLIFLCENWWLWVKVLIKYFPGVQLGISQHCPDSKIHGANMGPTRVLSAPDGPHAHPMNLAIRVGQIIFWYTICIEPLSAVMMA